MQDLPQAFRLAINERFQAAPWIWLLEVQIPGTIPQVLRIANHTKTVEFDADNTGSPASYYPASFGFSEIVFDTEGSLPELPLSVSNVTREAFAIMVNNDFLVGQPVRLMLVNADTLDNPEARFAFNLEVRSAVATEEACTFNLSSYSLNSIIAPRRRLTRSTCDFDYGGTACGFDIPGLDPGLATLGACPKTQAGCTLRGDAEVAASRPRLHPQRFGAFPGLPLSGR